MEKRLVPSLLASNTIDVPSGDHARPPTKASPGRARVGFVAGRCSPTTKMDSGITAPAPLTLAQASWEPSGDHVGEVSLRHSGGLQYVSTCRSDPSGSMVTMRHGPFPGSSLSTYAISPLLEILTGVCVAERWKARTATAIPNAAITRADVTAIAQR